jgi:DNA-binding beta-propeller fold protein YncE
MFAFFYLAIMTVLGDALVSRFYQFVSWPQRLATSFLVGILVSSPLTYVLALVFARTSSPLFWANIIYFIVVVPAICWINWRAPLRLTTAGFIALKLWDWIFLGLGFAFACWLMFATLSFRNGKFLLAFKAWSDFGANVSLLQSFALANNFPTTHPFFPSEPIRYHFLFWFQTANFSYLGLNSVWSVNILSVLSFISLLVLIATCAELLFESRVVGRLSSILFLLSSSLYYLPFLRNDTLQALVQRTNFLPSGYPWRGEDWGVLTISVLGYQRHLISGMGIFLIVMIFLVDKYRCRQKELVCVPTVQPDERPSEADSFAIDSANQNHEQVDSSVVNESSTNQPPRKPIDRSFLYQAIFSGVLIGLLPFWNSPAFVAAMAILCCLFLLLPFRVYTGALIFTALALGAPQVLLLRTRGTGQALLHWGYTLENPTVFQVVKYLGWSFGFKWVLIAIALLFLSSWQRKLFLAVCVLLAMVFTLQLSVDNFNNHKLLNIWTIFAAMYAAFGLWRVAKKGIVGVVCAIVVGVLTTLGGVIDLFPIHNDSMLVVAHKNDRLTTWVFEHTKASDLFLSERWLSHPILFAGRKLFLGNTLFAWSAGYDVGSREAVYRKMFEERDPAKLIQLLSENKIAYVAIDNGVRNSPLVKRLNEQVYESTFEKVFADDRREYDQLSIYKVASLKPASSQSQPNLPKDSIKISAFVGGEGDELGQFLRPRGIAIDRKGDFYVADSGNGRVVKFSSTGEFIALVGQSGQLREPNGVAIDSSDNLYVTDAGTHRLLKFRGDGSFEQEWSGPEPGFFGPRGVTIGSRGEVYVVDQGRSRIVKLSGDQFSHWGSRGSGDGELLEPTGVAVFNDRLYVADAQNGRIQVFDTNGRFISLLYLPEWRKSIWQYPDLMVDLEARRLYASSTVTNEVIAFDLAGQQLTLLKEVPMNGLDGPSGMALGSDRTLYVVNFKGARISRIPLPSQSR